MHECQGAHSPAGIVIPISGNLYTHIHTHISPKHTHTHAPHLVGVGVPSQGPAALGDIVHAGECIDGGAVQKGPGRVRPGQRGGGGSGTHSRIQICPEEGCDIPDRGKQPRVAGYSTHGIGVPVRDKALQPGVGVHEFIPCTDG